MKTIWSKLQKLGQSIKEVSILKKHQKMIPLPKKTQEAVQLSLYLPVSGQVKDLEQVSDCVFSERLIGDGVAIEPIDGIIVAPCDGQIIQVLPTNHAVGMITKEGVDLLIHVGIDTEWLRGRGFTRLVEEGQKVIQGEPLLKVDLETLKGLGKSTVTFFVITNMDKVNIEVINQGKGRAGESLVMQVEYREV